MSQYPSPYPQPPYYQPPIDFSQYYPVGPADLLAPARRAGVLMMVIGGLIALMGSCNLASALMQSPEQIAKQQEVFRTSGLPEAPIGPERLRTLAAIVAVAMVGVGLVFLLNGSYVRRGSPRAVVTAMILSICIGAGIGLFFVMCIAAALVSPPIAAFACMLAIPLALFVWLVVWLSAAARNNSAVAQAQQQYQAQFFQYQQQQQAYGWPWPQGSPYAPANPWSPAPPQASAERKDPQPPPPTTTG